MSSRRFLAVALSSLASLAMFTGSARAEYGFVPDSFKADVYKQDGVTSETQAGAHPYAAVSSFDLNRLSSETPDEHTRDLFASLPAGLVGDPTAVPACSRAKFAALIGQVDTCPAASQVGILNLDLALSENNPPFSSAFAVYNLAPRPGAAAAFGIPILTVPVQLEARLSKSGEYRIELVGEKLSQGLPFVRQKLTLWGVPSDPSHDSERFCGTGFPTGGCSVGAPRVPFLTSPTSCTGPVTTDLRADSWEDPGDFKYASYVTPVGAEGCEKVPFDPAVSVRPDSNRAESPTGLDVTISLPQSQDPAGLATAHLKDTTVVLPPGMAISPAAADGLGDCGEGQIGLASRAPVSFNGNRVGCPDSSKIGTVAVETPLIDHVLEGSIYLGRQNDPGAPGSENPFDSLLSLYVAIDDPDTGTLIKLAGRVTADPNTGQLTTTFENNPQTPFSEFALSFKGGPRATLVTPASCGTHTATSRLTSWAGGTVKTEDSFKVDRGPDGGACPSGRFEPALSAGTTNPTAGAFSPFVLRLSRPDGTQPLGGLSVTLPEGLLGKLAGIPYCPDSSLSAISGVEGAGGAELRSPSCPAASQVGTVQVGSGSGPSPFYADTGKAYLAGPYKGAPVSLAVVTPAVAGPFDLGNVVVRNALRVDPETTRLTAVSDPLPTILHGIPLSLRDVRLNIDRDRFTLNPTDCDPMAFSGSAVSATGARAPLTDRFQVANCERLAFKPKLALKLSGKTHRSAYPALRATVTMPPGGANIARGQVTLPKTEILAQEHIKTICTRVQYAAKACPKASIYGYAKAWSPLLDKPLQGPVYLRSSSNELPDLVASLDGQIHIDLSGRIDSVNARIRNTFEIVPDAPVSKFVLTMQGGKKGLLVNNTELCKAKPRAEVKFDAQNGKTADSKPLVKVDCGKKGKKRKK